MASLAVIPVMLLMFLLIFAVPIIIGVYIYRDATRRGMNAVLWTLLGLLAPGFIGLIIYLIVRGDYSDRRCAKCDNPVKVSYAVCPYCGASLKEHCASCGFSLEAGWIKCPGCGSEIPEEQRSSATEKKDTGKGLKWLLAIVIAIPVLLLVLMVSGIVLMRTTGYTSWLSTAQYTVDELTAENQDILNWVEECDAAGEGVYLLKSLSAEYSGSVSCLMYRNDGEFYVEPDMSSGGWFSSPAVSLKCSEQSDSGCTLFHVEAGIGNGDAMDIRVLDGSEELDVSVSYAEWLSVDSGQYVSILPEYEDIASCCYTEIYVSDALVDAYGVDVAILSGSDVVSSHGTCNADNSCIAGEQFFASYNVSCYDEPSMIFSLCDSATNFIYSTEEIAVENGCYVTVMFAPDENGEVTALVKVDSAD